MFPVFLLVNRGVSKEPEESFFFLNTQREGNQKEAKKRVVKNRVIETINVMTQKVGVIWGIIFDKVNEFTFHEIIIKKRIAQL